VDNASSRRPRQPLGQIAPLLRMEPPSIHRGAADVMARRVQTQRDRAEAELLNQQAFALRRQNRAPQGQAVVVPQAQFVATIEERMEMGVLIRARRCTEAIDMALTLSDIELATNVRGFCSGSPR
jgi:hypothetical protein